MTIENTLWGGLGGFFVAIVAALGIYKKIDGVNNKLEKMQDDVVYKDTCIANHKLVEKMQTDIEYIRERLDKVLD